MNPLTIIGLVVAGALLGGSVVSLLRPRRRLQDAPSSDSGSGAKAASGAVIRAIGDGVALYDYKGTQIDVNPAFEKLTGFTRAELVGVGMPKPYWPPEHAQRNAALLKGALAGELRSTDVVIMHKDGTRLDVWVSPSIVEGDTREETMIVASFRDVTQLKRAEKELKDSKRFLDEAQKVAHVGSWYWDLATDIVQWSEEMHRLMGVTPEEFDGKLDTAISRIHPEDLPGILEMNESIVTTGEHAPMDFRIVYPDKSERLMQGDGEVMLGEDGQPTGMIGTIRDITEQNSAQNALRQSEEQFRTIYENAPVMIDAFDAEGRCTLWNRECERMLGYTYDEIRVAKEPLSLAYPDAKVRQRVLDVIQMADGVFREYEVRAKSGDTRIQLWANFRLPNGSIIAVGHDMTERKQAEAALRGSETKLRQIMDLVPHMIFAKNIRGKFLLANQAVAEAYGVTVEELMGSQDKDYHKPGKELEQFLSDDKQVITSGRPKFIPEEGFVDVFGNERILQTTKIPFMMAGMDEAAVLGIAVDITWRKQIEEELKQSHRQLRALASRVHEVREEESASIAREIHDELGQTLTGLKLDLAWVQRRLVDLPASAVNEAILEKLSSMTREVDNTVHAVRRISTQLRPVVLDDLGLVGALEWQAREFENRTQINCQLDVEADIQELAPEPSTAVFRIFQEILTNVARHAEANRVTVRLSNEDDSLVLRVSDNGRGISQEDIRSTRALGILGMKERAQVCGGEVLIRRLPNGGTRVTVRVPLQQVV